MADDSGEIVREAAESVAFVNVKAGGMAAEAAMFYLAAGFAETNSQTQAMNQVRLATAARAADSILGTTADQATEMVGAALSGKTFVNAPPISGQT